MDSALWTTKYAPKHTSDIVGNTESVAYIKTWLKNFQNQENASIIICGPHGVGKSIAVKVILKDLGYEMKYLSSSNIKQFKMLKDATALVQTGNINLDMVFEDGNAKGKVKKTAVVIDDSETITLTSEKNMILQLFKDNEAKKMFPLIFLTNEQHSKMVSDIKKSCPEIKFNYPKTQDTSVFVKSICAKENIQLTDNVAITSIIQFSQYDIRRLLLILQDLKLTYGENSIGIDEWKKYMTSSHKKDKDIGLFEATKKILDNYKNINTCLQLYETEKVLLPLMVFENYPRNVLSRQIQSSSELLNVMRKITDYVSLGDVIETNIYTDQNWYLQHLHGFYTCVETSYVINRYKKKTDEPHHIDFSSDLNKTSLKNINKKNIIGVQSFMKDKNLTDLLYLNKLIHYSIKENKLKYIESLAQHYNLSSKTVEIIMKIDKTLEKINMTTKNKRAIQFPK